MCSYFNDLAKNRVELSTVRKIRSNQLKMEKLVEY